MDTLERLNAIQQIASLKARYFYYMDTKEWASFGDLFTEDCIMDMSGEAPPGVDPSVMIFRGRDHIVAAISGALGNVTTVHHGHTPIIELQSGSLATGIWTLEDNFYFADGGHMEGYGHYHEEYQKGADLWRISRSSVTRIRKTMTPGKTS